MCMCDDENSVFQVKSNICIAKFGEWEDSGDMGKNLSSKMPYFESPTLICLFTMQLYGATMMSIPRRKKSRFGPNFDDFWE